MGWEETTAPQFAGQPPTEGARAAAGGTHPQEKCSYGPTKTGVAQTSGDGVAETCCGPEGDMD